jgi:hypothetical protein
MLAVQAERIREQRVHWYQRAAAAVVLIGLALWGLGSLPDKQPVVTAALPASTPALPAGGVQDALEWFSRNQEPDGSWNPARWRGDARFEVALTALPLLALQSNAAATSPRQQESAAKAQRYLLSQCDAQGRFGPAFFGSSYTQAIATLALLSRYESQPDAETKLVLHRALDVIVSQQQPSGCWGVAGLAQPDVTVTWWQVEALKLAEKLGWDEVQPHISLGAKWLQAQRDPLPFPISPGSNDKVDYFALYRATTQLHESGDSLATDQLESLRQALLHKQVQHGEDFGSWTPDDRWATVGGRLYSTAMASLALR